MVGKPLIDVFTFANIYQPCAALAPAATMTEPSVYNYMTLTGMNARATNRCAALAAKGLVTGASTAEQAADALAKLRAVEHRRFLVRSTNSGVSAFVDPVGRVAGHTGTFRQEAIAAEIAWLRPWTLYGAVGDAPWWLVSAAALGMAFFRRREPKGE